MFVTKKLKSKINDNETNNTANLNLINDHKTRIEALETTLKEYIDYKKKKEGDEPFLELIGDELSAEYGLAVKLDWNAAMINYLKRNGYNGTTDEEIVQKYLVDMMNDKAKKDNDVG